MVTVVAAWMLDPVTCAAMAIGRAATSIVPAILTRFGVLLLLGILKVLLAMRVDDSLAFPSPKAYPTHSETLTVGLLASFPRRSFTAAS